MACAREQSSREPPPLRSSDPASVKRGFPRRLADVYLCGDPTELDLLAVRPTARPRCGIIYDPADVAVVLEVKFHGAFTKTTAEELRSRFSKIRAQHGHIQCAYITVGERLSYKHRITTDSLGFKAFTLYWRDNEGKVFNRGDSWDSVVEWVRTITGMFATPSGQNNC